MELGVNPKQGFCHKRNYWGYILFSVLALSSSLFLFWRENSTQKSVRNICQSVHFSCDSFKYFMIIRNVWSFLKIVVFLFLHHMFFVIKMKSCWVYKYQWNAFSVPQILLLKYLSHWFHQLCCKIGVRYIKKDPVLQFRF